MQKGYANSPSPPQNIRLDDIDTSSVIITWEEPEFNAGQVERYRVVVVEQIPIQEEEPTTNNEENNKEEEGGDYDFTTPEIPMFADGRAPKQIVIEVEVENVVKVSNLQSGTLYTAYVIAMGNSPTQRSLSSDVLGKPQQSETQVVTQSRLPNNRDASRNILLQGCCACTDQRSIYCTGLSLPHELNITQEGRFDLAAQSDGK
jgi:hypothetical protein